MESVTPPSDPMEAADLVLLHLIEKSSFFGEGIPFTHNTEYPLFALQNGPELKNVLNFMKDFGWIRIDGSSRYAVLPAGYTRRRELKDSQVVSTRGFVAMSFAPLLRPAYDDGIKPAIVASGFEPIRVDDLAHNDRIDERIIVELKRSAFVVADVSDPRTGVFFEAGFGLGLGLPVIWTCNAESFGQLPNHFDTRQFNHIRWESPAELCDALKLRIRRTVAGARLED